jgi:hypothetical protein
MNISFQEVSQSGSFPDTDDCADDHATFQEWKENEGNRDRLVSYLHNRMYIMSTLLKFMKWERESESIPYNKKDRGNFAKLMSTERYMWFLYRPLPSGCLFSDT